MAKQSDLDGEKVAAPRKAPTVITEGKTWVEVARIDPFVEMRLDASTASRDGFVTFDATFSRAGNVQSYFPGGAEVREWRPPVEVFHADSLASGRGRPVTLLHPRRPGTRTPGLLTPATALGQARGAILTFERVDDLHTGGQISVWDDMALRAIDRQVARQISLGHRVKIDPRPGHTDDGESFDQRQTRIRINHAAIEPRGKAESAEIKLDAATFVQDLTPYMTGRVPSAPVIFDFAGYARLDSLSSHTEAPMNIIKKTIVDLEVDLPEAVAAEFDRLDALSTALGEVKLPVLLAALEAGKTGDLAGLTALGVQVPEAERTDDMVIAKLHADLEQSRTDAAGWADALEVARRAHGLGFDPSTVGIKPLDVAALRLSVIGKVLGADNESRCDSAGAIDYAFTEARDRLRHKGDYGAQIRKEIAASRTDAKVAATDPIKVAAATRAKFNSTAHQAS